VEVIDWLDNPSRYLLHLSTHPRITGPTRYAGDGSHHGNNAFETLLALDGIT